MDKISETFETHNQREAAAMRALDRAYQRQAHGQFFELRTEGDRITARYGADRSEPYTVVVARCWTHCDCKAGQMDQICYHTAALADRVGMFDVFIYGFYTRAFPAPVTIDPIAAARVEVDRLRGIRQEHR